MFLFLIIADSLLKKDGHLLDHVPLGLGSEVVALVPLRLGSEVVALVPLRLCSEVVRHSLPVGTGQGQEMREVFHKNILHLLSYVLYLWCFHEQLGSGEVLTTLEEYT